MQPDECDRPRSQVNLYKIMSRGNTAPSDLSIVNDVRQTFENLNVQLCNILRLTRPQYNFIQFIFILYIVSNCNIFRYYWRYFKIQEHTTECCLFN